MTCNSRHPIGHRHSVRVSTAPQVKLCLRANLSSYIYMRIHVHLYDTSGAYAYSYTCVYIHTNVYVYVIDIQCVHIHVIHGRIYTHIPTCKSSSQSQKATAQVAQNSTTQPCWCFTTPCPVPASNAQPSSKNSSSSELFARAVSC